MTDDTTPDTDEAQCLMCEYTAAETADSVEFYELPDGAHWCSACRSAVDGWKQREHNAFLLLVNDDLPEDATETLREHLEDLPDGFGSLNDRGTVNAKHGEAE